MPEFQPYQIPGGRWVFAGSRNANGYASPEDAVIEWRAQLENRYEGSLNTGPVDHRVHANTAEMISDLAGMR